MARLIYALAVAAEHGWNGDALAQFANGLDFIEQHGRSACGGWVRTLASAFPATCLIQAVAARGGRASELRAVAIDVSVPGAPALGQSDEGCRLAEAVVTRNGVSAVMRRRSRDGGFGAPSSRRHKSEREREITRY